MLGLFISNMIIFFALGNFAAKIRVDYITPNLLKEQIVTKIRGNISHIKYTERGANIVLQDIILSELLLQEDYPVKIQISIKASDAKRVRIGDYIETLVFLSPFMGPVIPGGYDFGLSLYFKNIGASGYSMSDLEILERDDHNYISSIKSFLYYRLIDNLGKDIGNFASALFLGEQKGIRKDLLKDMRLAGVSHILCVSGLHISLVAGILYLYSRMILNFSNFLAFNFNIKKIAALIAILGGFFYLVLTGAGIASIRAFIMSLCVFLGVIFDRITLGIRSLSIAAFFILILNPEYILLPSFQLSFIAVLSLISGFELYLENKEKFDDYLSGFVSKAICLNIYSTFLASIATIPLVIYHFHIISNYAIISNLVIVPIVSFIIMPIGILALIITPLNLDIYLYKIVGISIDFVSKSADFIASLPFAVWHFGNITGTSLLLYLLGFFWMIAWKSRIRFLGIILMIIVFAYMSFIASPKIIINNEIGFAAYINEKSELEIVGDNLSKFNIEYIMSYFGKNSSVIINKPIEGLNFPLHQLSEGKKYQLK